MWASNYLKFTGSISVILVVLTLSLPSFLGYAQEPENRVFALAWSPDGTQLAIVGIFDDQPGIQLRDELGQLTRSIAMEDRVLSVAWSPDGTRLATTHIVTSTDSYLTTIWMIDSGSIAMTFEEIGNRDDTNPYWNPDSSRNLMATLNHGFIHIWDVETGRVVKLLIPPSSNRGFEALTWNRDGTALFTWSSDGFLRAWDTDTWRIVQELQQTATTDLAVSSDGTQLAISTVDHLVTVEADTFEVKWILSTETIPANSFLGACWHPDGTQIATYGYYSISVWDVASGETLITIPFPETLSTRMPDAMDYSPNGELVYAFEGKIIFLRTIVDLAQETDDAPQCPRWIIG